MTDNCIFILMYIWKRLLLQVFLNENICSVIISCFKLNNVFLNHIIPLQMSDWSCHIQLSGLILRDEHIHSNHFFGKTIKNTMFILTSHVTNEKKKSHVTNSHLLCYTPFPLIKVIFAFYQSWHYRKWKEFPAILGSEHLINDRSDRCNLLPLKLHNRGVWFSLS